MNESRESKNAEQLEELLLLTEEIQEELEQKDQLIEELKTQLSESSDLEREIKQREQSREYSSIKERLEAGRQSIADREREAAKRKRHDRGMSRYPSIF